jgi:hypothetical protein
VKPDDESRVEGHARFRTTQWTVIMLAAQSKTPEGKAALAELYENLFDARWATTLLTQVLSRLGQAYASEGKTPTFEALKVFLDPINSRSAPSYEEVASRIQVSSGAAKTLIHRLRKRFTALLREEVGRTVSDPSEVDGEIHALCESLIASGGRIKP